MTTFEYAKNENWETKLESRLYFISQDYLCLKCIDKYEHLKLLSVFLFILSKIIYQFLKGTSIYRFQIGLLLFRQSRANHSKTLLSTRPIFF